MEKKNMLELHTELEAFETANKKTVQKKGKN